VGQGSLAPAPAPEVVTRYSAAMAQPPKLKKAKSPPAPDPASLPDVERHDEVYFRHHESGAPMVGRVLCRGAHGCFVDVEGKRHKVRWEQLHGHKLKVSPVAKVVDQGLDGFIAESPGGHRRFVRDPLGAAAPPAAKPMAKSTGPAVIFFGRPGELAKAMGVKNRPGLSLQDVTDKAGHQTKRWKKTAVEQPKERPHAAAKPDGKGRPKAKAKEGERVAFGKGEGRVVGSPGADGAYVRAADGQVHKVLYEDMKPAKPDYAPRAEGEHDKAYAKRVIDKGDVPTSLPEDHERYFKGAAGALSIPLDKLRSAKSDEENAQGGDNGPKRMLAAYHGALDKRDPIKVTPNTDGSFTIVDGNGTYTSAKKLGWSSLPVWIVQPQDSKEEVLAKAAEATDLLRDWLNQGKGVCSKAGFTTMAKAPEDLKPEEWEAPGGMLFIAPPKSEKRAAEKVEADYGGDWSRLVDGSRCTVAVDTLDEVNEILDRLHASGMVVAREKDRFKKPTSEGYRDRLLNIRLANGTVAELQVHVKPMTAAKALGHDDYKVSRTIIGKYEDPDPESWDPADKKAYEESVERQRALYSNAWKRATGLESDGSKD
jgi:hypothetical protein